MVEMSTETDEASVIAQLSFVLPGCFVKGGMFTELYL